MPPPPGFEEIQEQELSRLYGKVVGIRLWFLPAVVALVAFLAWTEPAAWRTPFLAGALLPIGTFFVAEAFRVRRTGLTTAGLVLNLAGGALGQAALAFATGALESPVTYAFVPLAIMIGVFAPRGARLALVGLQIALVWTMAAVELAGAIPDLNLHLFGGGARAGHVDAHLVATAALLSLVLALGSRAGAGVRAAFDAMLARAVRAQQESLRAHAERAEELTALSGEIAHELKNPLASVKGLAALLAEGVPAGKPAERLAVLRREVDRMQGVLEDFLNFSRPLVPLAIAPLDLAAVAREVAALHEGLAHDRDVRVEVRGGSTEVRADPRKVKQVLINLVQNAVEASPAGGVVELVVEGEDGAARLSVLDRGAGLAAAVGARAFDPGVTSKPRGSGLGLTIARALARQHGGEVALAARPGGGCAAELRLLAAGPPTGAAAAGGEA